MDVDSRYGSPIAGAPTRTGGGELKIKGQAEVEKRKSTGQSDVGLALLSLDSQSDLCFGIRQGNGKKLDLEKRESELKEKALRNKVVRSRVKGSG